MKWINSAEYYPGLESGLIIVEGSTNLLLNDRGKIPCKEQPGAYSSDGFIKVTFSQIIEADWLYLNSTHEISLEGAFIKSISQLSDYEEDEAKCNSHFRKIGLYEQTINEFVDDQFFHYEISDVERWAKLEDQE